MSTGRTWALPAAGGLLALVALERWQAVWRGLPDYGFGWAVPILAGYLAWERWPDRPAPAGPADAPPLRWWLAAAVAIGAFAVLRPILEPFPAWPAAVWLFSGLAIGTALGGLRLAGGAAAARHFTFPLLFLATALPWPTVLDTRAILPLRTALAGIATEVVNQLGFPAFAQGTVIQVGACSVGVDEACSGIRSLQAAIMVALFLGELSRGRLARRVSLVAAGIGLALTTNLLRTVFLAWQGAVHGASGIARWHDAAGYALLVTTFGGLILVYLAGDAGVPLPGPRATSAVRPGNPPVLRRPAWIATLALAFSASLVAVEIGTQLWYAQGDRLTRAAPHLALRLPTTDPTFAADPFTASMQALLACDTHQLGHWTTDSRLRCAAYVLEWRTGEAARFTPVLHNPTLCLPASGSQLVADRGLVSARAGAITLPFHAYLFASAQQTLHVFYLAWDVRAARPLVRSSSARGATDWITRQWDEVRAARRSFAAQVVALAFYDAPSDREADEALRGELARMRAP